MSETAPEQQPQEQTAAPVIHDVVTPPGGPDAVVLEAAVTQSEGFRNYKPDPNLSHEANALARMEAGKASVEKAQQAAQRAAEAPQTDDGQTVPKGRMDQVIKERNELRDQIRQLIAAQAQQAQQPQQPAEAQPQPVDYEALQADLAKAHEGGVATEIANAQMRAMQALRDEIRGDIRQEMASAERSTIDAGRYSIEVAGLRARHPELVPNQPNYNKEAADMLAAAQSGYTAGGMDAVEAMHKAEQQLMGYGVLSTPGGQPAVNGNANSQQSNNPLAALLQQPGAKSAAPTPDLAQLPSRTPQEAQSANLDAAAKSALQKAIHSPQEFDAEWRAGAYNNMRGDTAVPVG